MCALPSMKTVPLMVSVFVVAFQASSPLGGVDQSTLCEMTWDAATLLLAPRVTVHVVVPKPAVTFMYSSSIRIMNAVVGKPVAELTVIVVWVELTAPASVVFAPGPTRQ